MTTLKLISKWRRQNSSWIIYIESFKFLHDCCEETTSDSRLENVANAMLHIHDVIRMCQIEKWPANLWRDGEVNRVDKVVQRHNQAEESHDEQKGLGLPRAPGFGWNVTIEFQAGQIDVKCQDQNQVEDGQEHGAVVDPDPGQGLSIDQDHGVLSNVKLWWAYID